MITQFFIVFKDYLIEVFPFLAYRVFPDGRAFIKGVSDKETARSLYAKYIGE